MRSISLSESAWRTDRLTRWYLVSPFMRRVGVCSCLVTKARKTLRSASYFKQTFERFWILPARYWVLSYDHGFESQLYIYSCKWRLSSLDFFSWLFSPLYFLQMALWSDLRGILRDTDLYVFIFKMAADTRKWPLCMITSQASKLHLQASFVSKTLRIFILYSL